FRHLHPERRRRGVLRGDGSGRGLIRLRAAKVERRSLFSTPKGRGPARRRFRLRRTELSELQNGLRRRATKERCGGRWAFRAERGAGPKTDFAGRLARG